MSRKKKPACTIVIRCDEPNEQGKLHVEMTCDGDELLAAYLLESAQALLDCKAKSVH